MKTPPTGRRNLTSPHCRICGYTPRGSIYARSLSEQVINHIHSKHHEFAFDAISELDILLGQQKGDDSRCLFHASAQKAKQS